MKIDWICVWYFGTLTRYVLRKHAEFLQKGSIEFFVIIDRYDIVNNNLRLFFENGSTIILYGYPFAIYQDCDLVF